MKHLFPAFTLIALAGAAHAHEGVTNPAVMARMHAMKSIGAEMKALSAMAKGEVAFDGQDVTRRMSEIAALGNQVPGLFEAPESDPESEAAAAIWVSFPEFTMRASQMIEAAQAGVGASDAFELDDAVSALGVTCKSCHDSFRLKR